MINSVETTVSTLLAVAGLEVSEQEFAALVASYPQQRAALDALYDVPMTKEEEPQLVFTPYE